MPTNFETKCAILSDLWLNYKDNEELADFVEYNDLGLPLAYLIHTDLVTVNETGMPYVDETFNLLCTSLGLDFEGDYASLNELMELQDDDEDEEE
jgi:hypothetical protein